MKTIRQTYLIKSSVEEAWKALIDPKYINGWGGGPAKMNDKLGAEFSLWGGSIFGKNIEVKPGKKLVQEWYSEEKWEKPSIATFTLSEEKNGVKLTLFHTNVPDKAAEDIDEGWKIYYLGPLKKFLEGKKRKPIIF